MLDRLDVRRRPDLRKERRAKDEQGIKEGVDWGSLRGKALLGRRAGGHVRLPGLRTQKSMWENTGWTRTQG